MQDWLDFARIHVRWTICDWTPESRVCLDFTDRRQLVWIMPKERFDDLNVAEHGHYARAQSWFGQALASMEKTDLYAIENRTLTPLGYCNEILDQFVRPYVGCIDQKFILMDDNV